MTEINWHTFKSKFYQRETTVFENLSYQLFCFEHKQPYGIFRFKNQTGIEVEPIQIDDNIIGFQSKYYDAKLAEKKEDLLKSLRNAKSKNPELTALYIYVNKEFSESSNKNVKSPKYKTEIESAAKELKVDIIWRVPSNFEIQLADPQNFHIAEYYFSNNSNIIDFLNAISKHADNILYAIHNDIKYKEKTIQIDRTELISELKNPISKIKIISGEGGCGKTALIKNLHQELKKNDPIYVFKALEFGVQNIQNVFNQFGNKTFADFLEVHRNDTAKTIVIDSAESLSEINNREVFKEFLSALLNDGWQIIFTTRINYLDDLRFQFIDIYRIPFQSIMIENPNIEVLKELSAKYLFNLPDEFSLKDLLRNLFYLNEYLTYYNEFDTATTINNFKNILWNKKILNSGFTDKHINIQRENCFLEIVKEKVNTGRFYVSAEKCCQDILSLLIKDEIINHDTNNGAYFITHDIYEEWALHVIIGRAYGQSVTYDEFFDFIGSSLAVRRSFRKWLSAKIADSTADIENFITKSINSTNISNFWKDEIFITILLAENADIFFNNFETLLFKDDLNYLKRIVFLLRIACKEVDEAHNRLYDGQDLKHTFTKPKGKGWNCVIELIIKNLSGFTSENTVFILPALQEWTKKNPRGKTTQEAGKIALELYRKIQTVEDYKYLRIEKQLVEIVLNSSLEIQQELKVLLEEILLIENTQKNLPYSELLESILTAQFENFVLIKALPKLVIDLARKCWINTTVDNEPFYSHLGTEKEFGIKISSRSEYSPASAYQTPIYFLLEFDFLSTLNFIIEITNGAVDSYNNSTNVNTLEEIQLEFPENKKVKQFINSEFWCMYRGMGNSPELLQSIHMALEKYLLEKAPITEDHIIEQWLYYILEKSKSASLTAVISSILKANTGKYFNIEKILFSSPEILLHDRMCIYSDQSEYGFNSFRRSWNSDSTFYENERELASKEHHRDTTLEVMIINYQFFRDETTSDKTAKQKRKAMEEIIDRLYSRFPELPDSSDDYMTRRLLISQLDRRKMSPVVEQRDNQVFINLNPEVQSDLKAHSEEALKSIKKHSKYIPLKLWSHNKFDNRTKISNKEKYENNPKLALEEARELLRELESGDYNLNDDVPAFVCTALLKEFPQILSEEDLNFCTKIILRYASLHFKANYSYQISDGVEVAISALPTISKLHPHLLGNIKIILLLTLFDDTSLGEYKRICDYAIETIYGDLLNLHGEMNHEFITAFLNFKPIFDSFRNTSFTSRANRHNQIEKFLKKHSKDINDFAYNNTLMDHPYIENYSLENLEIVFKLIPVDTQNPKLLDLVSKIAPIAARELLVKNEDYSRRHSFRRKFLNRFAYFLLNRKLENIANFTQPFIANLNDSQESAHFLREIIRVQDSICKYEEFWKIWHLFYDKVVSISKFKKSFFVNEVVYTYLLAEQYWGSGAKEWHSLKNREKQFLENSANDIGNRYEVLHSFSKILNGIASTFLNEGINWLSQIISMQDQSGINRQEEYTIFYLENIVRRYIYLNREKIKKEIRIKNEVITILNYLIEKASVSAYLLREDIL